MVKYVAFLRGIGPGNPNMRNDRLRSVFEDLGYDNVQSVISSGNIVFESNKTDTKAMESELEAAWPEKLGFTSTTIIRSQFDLKKLVELKPFGDIQHGPKRYLLTTFFKTPKKTQLDTPLRPEGSASELIKSTDSNLFSITDTTVGSSLDIMNWIEKQFGKQITSRTWLTVNRILKKME